MQKNAPIIEIVLFSILAVLLASCKTAPPLHGTSLDQSQIAFREGMIADRAIAAHSANLPRNISDALMPPLDPIQSTVTKSQHRFDVSANKLPARTFFLGLVQGTNLNMVVNPQVQGDITLNLKNVTIEETMEAVKDLYGYEYKKTNYGFEILPLALQTEVFPINYLDIQRTGKSLTQIDTSQISQKISGTSAGSGSSTGSSNGGGGSNNGGSNTASTETPSGSSVETLSVMDFWKVLGATIKDMVGTANGRSVLINPQGGVVIITAYPPELRRVASYLDSIQSNMQRQVILEAKILEVTLNDSYQAGVDWSLFGNPNGAGALFQQQGHLLSGTSLNAGMFTLNYKGDFRTIIDLLQQQGNVQVLSSPRISTVNNQKAIIKVGQDEFFVTGVTSSTVTSGTSVVPTSSVSLTPFFSGITLDVTPQISKEGYIILHVHPAVSEVSEDQKKIDLGSNGSQSGGSNVLSLPLAKSTIRESDNVVRAKNGQVIVIGGLMKNDMSETNNNVPGISKIPFIGALFRSTKQSMNKTELVILLRPVIARNKEWTNSLQRADNNFESVRRGFHVGGLTDDLGNEAERE